MKKAAFNSKWIVIIEGTLILLVGAVISVYMGRVVFEKEKTALVLQASSVAALIDSTQVESLSSDSSDLLKPQYADLKSEMVELKRVNKEARFVYLMGYREDIDKMFFYVDSESPEDEVSYSPPGQVYEESSDLEISNFIRGIAFAEGPYSDRWGKWISAAAPIYSKTTGRPIAIVGIDVNAKNMILDIAYAAVLPFLLSLFLVAILYVSYKMRQRQKDDELNNIKMEFTSFMSHEIRGFIGKIKMSLKMLQNEELGALADDQKVYLHEMIGQTDSFSELIEEFLEIGKIEKDNEISLSKSDANLLDIIKGVIGDLREQLDKKSVTIVYEGNMPEKVYASCDSNKMARVFANITGNAIKYSPERGVIHFGYIDGNTAHTIYIKNDGIGIPEGDKDKMFTKFFRASNAREIHSSGTGLGLYFSKLIVEKHGGKIWFESEEGSGATFFISIPKI